MKKGSSQLPNLYNHSIFIWRVKLKHFYMPQETISQENTTQEINIDSMFDPSPQPIINFEGYYKTIVHEETIVFQILPQ